MFANTWVKKVVSRVRGGKPRRPRPTRSPLGVERLDQRDVPAIVWANAGSGDGFDATYTSNAGVARGVVYQAIADWQAAITNFNYTSPALNNTFQLYVYATDLGPDTRGETSNVYYETSSRKPIQATVRLDNNASGNGWYFDPTPGSSSEFTDTVTRYEGAMPGSVADYYRTAVHEIGHALGIRLDNPGGLKIMDYMTATPGSPWAYNFSSNGTTASFTSDGHVYAELEGQGSASYFQAGNARQKDLMNGGNSVGYTDVTRQHISPLDLNILRDGYNYTVNPAALRSFAYATDEVGAFNPGATGSEFRLRNADGSQTWISFGGAGTIPIAGDWDGDGKDDVGSYNPNSTGTEFKLRYANGGQEWFSFGGPGWTPIVGDWDGDGRDEVGAFNPNSSGSEFRLRNRDGTVSAVNFGGPGWTPVIGDWNGDGLDDIGAFNPGATGSEFRQLNRDGSQTWISFGGAGTVPIAGDWDGDGKDDVGSFNPSSSGTEFKLRNGNGSQTWINFGGPGWSPITGNWNF